MAATPYYGHSYCDGSKTVMHTEDVSCRSTLACTGRRDDVAFRDPLPQAFKPRINLSLVDCYTNIPQHVPLSNKAGSPGN